MARNVRNTRTENVWISQQNKSNTHTQTLTHFNTGNGKPHVYNQATRLLLFSLYRPAVAVSIAAFVCKKAGSESMIDVSKPTENGQKEKGLVKALSVCV